MGCDACDFAQADPVGVYFIRVGAANVQVTGCPDHVTELIRIYRLGLHGGGDHMLPPVPQAIDRPPDFNKNLMAQNVCVECGISWAERSPNCPKMLTNRHPVP